MSVIFPSDKCKGTHTLYVTQFILVKKKVNSSKKTKAYSHIQHTTHSLMAFSNMHDERSVYCAYSYTHMYTCTSSENVQSLRSITNSLSNSCLIIYSILTTLAYFVSRVHVSKHIVSIQWKNKFIFILKPKSNPMFGISYWICAFLI